MKTIRVLGRSVPVAPVLLILLGASLWPEMELLVPSLPAMKVAFGVTDGEIQQLLTANFMGFLCGVLFAGPLCDSFGRKKVAAWGMLFYLIASLGTIMAHSFSLLMLARFIQGLAMTAPIIGGGAMLLECTSGPAQIFWMSISSASITICMAMAPLLGAWINTAYGFRGNLWSIFIVGVLGIIPMLLFVPETLAAEKRSSMQLKALGKSYLRLLQDRRFMGFSFVMSALAASYWVYTGVSALYMVDYLHLDASLFGRYQGPIVGAFATMSIAISGIHRRLGVYRCLRLGMMSTCFGVVSLLLLALFGIESAVLTTIFMMFFVAGMVPANSLLFPSALNGLPQELQGSGQSLIQGLRLALASMGTMILGFTYTGPFLPVALLLAGMFTASTFVLWKMWGYLSDAPSSGIQSGH